MKHFFESSSLLLGAPLFVLGFLGIGAAMLAAFAPEKPAVAGGLALPAGPRHVAHPGPSEYVMVGGVLAFITAIEVALYYISLPRMLFIVVLLVLSALKFVTVVMYFMHLKFDSKLFTTAFVTGMVAAFAVFTVVLATLGANLV